MENVGIANRIIASIPQPITDNISLPRDAIRKDIPVIRIEPSSRINNTKKGL